MSRRAVIGRGSARLIAALIVAVAASVAAAPLTEAGGGTVVVHPTGDFPDDVDAVQAAVDGGGTVLLKSVAADGTPASFNFGPAEPGSGHVALTRDVRVLGESSGSAQTVIRGGHAPLRSFQAISTEVRGVTFEAPLRFALLLTAPSPAERVIVDNRITGLVGQALPRGGTIAEAIVIRGGPVLIADNVVEDTRSDRAIGISQFRSTGPIEITGNRVTGSTGIGIEATANDGEVVIADNVVSVGPEGRFATGIEVNGRGLYQLTDNDVLVQHRFGTGLLAFSPGDDFFRFGFMSGLVVERNDVDIDAEWDAIAFVGTISDAYVAHNNMSGRGGTAFWLQGFGPEAELRSNAFVGNNIAELETSIATAFLDEPTLYSTLVGQVGSVIDLGTANRYSGDRAGGGLGQELREAMEQRHAQAVDDHGRFAASDHTTTF